MGLSWHFGRPWPLCLTSELNTNPGLITVCCEVLGTVNRETNLPLQSLVTERERVTADLRCLEARGAGLNDMFSFHKHGQWSPQGARGEGREGNLRVGRVNWLERPEPPAGI